MAVKAPARRANARMSVHLRPTRRTADPSESWPIAYVVRSAVSMLPSAWLETDSSVLMAALVTANGLRAQ